MAEPKLHEHDGELHTLQEWARIKDISYGTLAQRLRNGWTLERALCEGVGDSIGRPPGPGSLAAKLAHLEDRVKELEQAKSTEKG